MARAQVATAERAGSPSIIGAVGSVGTARWPVDAATGTCAYTQKHNPCRPWFNRRCTHISKYAANTVGQKQMLVFKEPRFTPFIFLECVNILNPSIFVQEIQF